MINVRSLIVLRIAFRFVAAYAAKWTKQ